MPNLLMLVLYNLNHFEDVVAAWHDNGAPELTIMDGVGTRLPWEQMKRDDLPLLPSIRDLLQSDDAPRRIIFTTVPDHVVDPLIVVTERILGDLHERGNGTLIALPVARVVGLREL
jgi:hypothetical protein